VIFDEPVNDVQIISDLKLVEDSENKEGKTGFKWSYTEKDDAERTYPVSIKATDLAGNISEIKIGDISIDATLPSLKSFSPIDAFITAGDSVEIKFELNEENNGPPEVKIGSYTLSSEECSNDGLEYRCSHDETDGKLDKDGKTESGSDPVELDGEKKVSVNMIDLAGNTSEALLGTVVYDRIAPVVNGSVITPANARAGSVIAFSISFNEYVTDFILDSGDLKFEECTSEDQYQFSCTYIVNGSETEGEYILKTTVTDRAGNKSDPTPASPFSIDLTSPEITVEDVLIETDTGIISDDDIHKAKDGSTVTVSFTILSTNELLGMPEVIIDSTNAIFQSEESGKYTFSLNVESVVSTDGKKPVILRAYDESGNPGVINIGNVIYDFTPPKIVDFSLLRVPELISAIDNGNDRTYFSIKDPISGETVTAKITVYADEMIVDPKLEVIGSGSKPVFNRVSHLDKKAEFSSDLKETVDSGEYGFRIIWEDELGNSNEDDITEIVMKMVVDKNVPDISGTDFSKITYHRLPFGEKDDPVSRFFVEGVAGAVDSSGIVYLFSTSYDPSGTSFAGSVFPESEGSFLVDTRAVGNSPYMYLRIGNRAGVLSEPKRVKLNKWTGTLKGKIPGSSSENGIEYGKRVSRANSLKNSGELMKYLDSYEDIESLSESDSTFLTSGNDLNMTINSTHPDELPDLENSEFIVDPIRGKIFVFKFPDETSQIEIYSIDISTKTLKQVNYAGISPNPRSRFNLIYNNYENSIFFAGGSQSGNNMDDVWQFYPDTLEWDQITPEWYQIDPWTLDAEKTNEYPVVKAWASFIDVVNYDIKEHKFYYFRFADGSYAGNQLNGVAVYDVKYKTWSSLEQDSTPIPFPSQYGFDVNDAFYDMTGSKLCFIGSETIYRMDSFTGQWDTIDLSAVDYNSFLGFDNLRRKIVFRKSSEMKAYDLDTSVVEPVFNFAAFFPEKLEYLAMDDKFYCTDDNDIIKAVNASTFTVSNAMKTPTPLPAPEKTDGNPVYFYSELKDSLYVYMGYYTNKHQRQLWKFSFEDDTWTNLEPETEVFTSQPPSTFTKSIFYRQLTGKITVAGPYWDSKGYFYEFDETPEQMLWNEVLLGTDPAPLGYYSAVTVDYDNEIYYFLVCQVDHQDCTVHSFNDIEKTWNDLGIGIMERSAYYQMALIPDLNYLVVTASTGIDDDMNKTLVYDLSGNTLVKTLTNENSPRNIRTLSYIDFSGTLLSVETDVYNATVWNFNFDSLEWEKKDTTNAVTAELDEGVFLFERSKPESQILLLNKINELMDFDFGYTSKTENILELTLPDIFNDRNNYNPDLISYLSIYAVSKGLSYDSQKDDLDGVELSVWKTDKWDVVRSNTAGLDVTDQAQMELNYTLNNKSEIMQIFDSEDRSLFVKMAPYLYARKDGQLEVDFIQIEVDYSFPDCDESTCNENGECDDQNSPVLCACYEDFTGEFCEIEY